MTQQPRDPGSERNSGGVTGERLAASFARVRDIADPVDRVLVAEREAERLELDPALYHRLFDLHDRPEAPEPGGFDRVLTRVVAWCDRQTFFSLLEYVGRMAIVLAILSFFSEFPERRQMRVGEEWQRIQDARGKAWSGDRHAAIERLATSCVALEGLAAPGARLEGLRLDGCRGPFGALSGTWLGNLGQPRGAVLVGADLQKARLSRSQLTRANLTEAMLDGVDLSFADLSEASLRGARLAGADLFGADLSSADLTDAVLDGANLGRANLRGAILEEASLESAKLHFADLRGADASHVHAPRSAWVAARLEGASLLGAEWTGADLHAVRVDRRTVLDHVRWSGAQVDEGSIGADQMALADNRPHIEPRPANGGRTVVGIVVPAELDFYRDVVAGAEAAANAAGAELRVLGLEALDSESTALGRFHSVFSAFEKSSALLTERLAVGQLVGHGVDALLMSPRGGASSDAVLRWAFESGVPVALYDNTASSEVLERWVSAAFTTDAYQMGWEIGQYTARWAASRRDSADEPWRIGLVRSCDYENCFERVAGFRAALDAAGLPWNEVFYRRIRFEEEAAEVAFELLERHRDVEILWAATEDGTNALLDAIDRHGVGLHMWVFGTDWSSRTAAAMRLEEPRRVLEAVVVQQPREMGRRAVEAVLSTTAGRASSPVVTLPHVVLDDPSAADRLGLSGS